MLSRPQGCETCPLNTTSKAGFCPDKIPVNAKILFLAEAPGTTEITKAEPMVGKAGFVLREWLVKNVPLLRIAMERDEVGLANVLRCLPKEIQGRPYPRGQEKEQAEAICRQHDAWPDSIHTYVLFGEHSQRLLFKQELEAEDAQDRALGHDLKGVTGRVGRVYERDGKRWVFAPHPAYILRQPALVTHGQRALEIATGVDRVVAPEYHSWVSAMGELL